MLHRLHIDGYLQFEDFALDFGPRLNVLHGPNEAGKSTLLRFIRYVLFGPPRLTAQRGLPLRGAKFGGTLWLGPEPLRVQRTGKELQLTAQGVPRPDADLHALLGQFDQAAFDAVYACDLDDLQQMGALQADALRRKLFASTVLGPSVDVDAVEERWSKRRRALATRGRRGLLWRLDRALTVARRELDEAQARARELPAMYERLAEIDRAIDETTALSTQARTALTTHEALAAARPEIERRTALRDRLAAPPKDAPAALHEARQAAAQALAEAQRALAATPIPGPALALKPRLAELRATDRRHRDHEAEVQRIERRREALAGQVAALRATWPTLAAATPPTLRRLRADLERWHHDELERQVTHRRLLEDRARVRRQIDRLATPRPVPEIPATALGWSERRATMAERNARLDEHRAHRDRLARELEASLADHPRVTDRATLRTCAHVPWAHVAELTRTALAYGDPARGLGLSTPPAPLLKRRVAALAGVVRHGGRSRWRLVLRTALVAAALLVVAGVVATVVTGVSARATAVVLAAVILGMAGLVGEQLRDAQRLRQQSQHDTETQLQAHLADVTALQGASVAELRDLAERMPNWLQGLRALQSEDAEIEALEASLARWIDAARPVAEALDEPSPSNLTEAEALARHVTTRAEAARHAAVAEAARLDALATQEQLLPDLDARAAATVAPRDSAVRARIEALGGHAIEPAQWLDWITASLDAAPLIAQQASLEADRAVAQTKQRREATALIEVLGTAGVPSLAALDEAMRQAEEEARARSAAEAHLAACAEAHDRSERALTEARAALDASRQALEAELTQLDRRLPPAAVDPIDFEALETTISGARDRVTALQHEKDTLVEQRGALKQAIEDLAASARVAEAAEEVQGIETSLHQARLELAEIELASRWLREAYERYVHDNQPSVLRRASDLLRRASDGSMVGVRQRSEQDRALFVESASGGTREPHELSRGSREMLYLVIRLALALEHAARTAVPLLLDDVMVNQDPERACQIAQVLHAVGERHQVILMTCRPETRDLVVQVDPSTRVIELPRFVTA